MNVEKKLQFRMFLKLLWVCVFALLYAWGGMEMKWLRRFIAPVWLTSGMFIFSRDWKVFLQSPLLMISLSLGYGADTFWVKVIKRTIYGLLNGMTAITHLFNNKTIKRDFWVLFILNIIVVTLACILLGVFNPVAARAEELILGFFIGFLSMFIPKDYYKNY